MNRDELIAAYKDLAEKFPIEDTDFWSQKWQEIRQRMIAEGPENFLTWSVIIATMFVGDAPYTAEEYAFLTRDKEEDVRWWDAFREPRIGNPAVFQVIEEYLGEFYTSGNLIHQAYHLARWEAHTGKKVGDLKQIVEFGGGYGALALIVRRIGFTGHYTITDHVDLLLLQKWYLAQAGITDIDFINTNLTADDGTLFIALWSLSESPRSWQEHIAGHLDHAYVLVAANDSDESFFGLMTANMHYTWTREPTAVEGNSYLYGTRKEAPKAPPQRKRRK